MKNADKPIYPCVMQQVGEDSYRVARPGDPQYHSIPTEGLTKREHFAAMAMQGELAGQYASTEKTQGVAWYNEKELAQRAVLVADALLAELEKGKEVEGE